MRISDWSSDVCSSDLADAVEPVGQRGAGGSHELHVGGVAGGLEAEPVIVAGVVGHEDVVRDQGVGGGGADLVAVRSPRAGGCALLQGAEAGGVAHAGWSSRAAARSSRPDRKSTRLNSS